MPFLEISSYPKLKVSPRVSTHQQNLHSSGSHAVVLRLMKVCLHQASKEAKMQIVYERCVGLDVHAKTVVACLMIR